jgi:hypothetical protein
MASKTPVVSLLLPTRQRRERFIGFYNSAMQTADNPQRVEVVAYVDDDDSSYDGLKLPRLTLVRGPRVVLSEMWNKCWENAKGTIYGHMGDDILFRTKGWDTEIVNAINSFPNKIGLVWGDDLNDESQRNEFCTHGFIHKNWTDVTGRFVPPYFSSDYNDTWFNDVSKGIGKQRYLHHVKTEHMHFSLGKSEMDQNTRDRLERHQRDRPEEIYRSRSCRIERADEIERLRQRAEQKTNKP